MKAKAGYVMLASPENHMKMASKAAILEELGLYKTVRENYFNVLQMCGRVIYLFTSRLSPSCLLLSWAWADCSPPPPLQQMGRWGGSTDTHCHTERSHQSECSAPALLSSSSSRGPTLIFCNSEQCRLTLKTLSVERNAT